MQVPQLGVLAVVLLAALATAQDCQTDVLIVLDGSGSVKDEHNKQVEYIAKMVDGLGISSDGVRVAGLLFNGLTRIKFGFDDFTSNEALSRVVEKKFPLLRGITNAGVALTEAMEVLKTRRSGVPLSVVVLHDGFSWDDTRQPADALRGETDTRVMAVGVVEPIWREELEAIADSPDMVFIGPGSVQDVLKAVLSGCVPREPVTQPPTTPRPTPRPTARPTAAPTPAPVRPVATTPAPIVSVTKKEVQGCVLDLLFIMDASGSIEAIWQEEQSVAKDVVDLLTVGPENAHVGLIRFAGRGKNRLQFGLTEYFDKEEIKQAIDKAPFIGGTTDIAGALEQAREVLTDPVRAARKGAPKVIILFSDGYSFTDPVPAAAALRDSFDEVVVFALAIKQKAFNTAELARIADGEDKVFTDETFGDFEAAYERVTESCRGRIN